MRELLALDLPGGPAFVAALVRAWDDGDAILPIDQRLPRSAKAELLARMGATRVVEPAGTTRLSGGWPIEPGDALVVATSGSTGTPKGVILTHDAVAASAEATSQRLGVGPDDHWLACLPLSHVGGLSVITRALHTGTPLTVHPGFDHQAVMASGATMVSLVATTLARIDPSVFRTIVIGGSRPPAERPPNSVATYGMTETGSGVVYDGMPLKGVKVRIVDGLIELNGPMLLRGYRDGTTPIDADGWLSTGDLGHLDDDGGLRVEGRAADLIITGGENVWPEPVEEAIRTEVGVADVAVVGRADPEWGHAVTAVIVPVDPSMPPSLDAIRNGVKAVLPAYCAPRRIEYVRALPRTGLGKLRRHEIPDGSSAGSSEPLD